MPWACLQVPVLPRNPSASWGPDLSTGSKATQVLGHFLPSSKNLKKYFMSLPGWGLQLLAGGPGASPLQDHGCGQGVLRGALQRQGRGRWRAGQGELRGVRVLRAQPGLGGNVAGRAASSQGLRSFQPAQTHRKPILSPRASCSQKGWGVHPPLAMGEGFDL